MVMPVTPEMPSRRPITIPAASEKIEMYSPAYYRACVIGGILSCGLTHTMVSGSWAPLTASGSGGAWTAGAMH